MIVRNEKKNKMEYTPYMYDKNKIKTTKFKGNSLNSTRPKYVADVAMK